MLPGLSDPRIWTMVVAGALFLVAPLLLRLPSRRRFVGTVRPEWLRRIGYALLLTALLWMMYA